MFCGIYAAQLGLDIPQQVGGFCYGTVTAHARKKRPFLHTTVAMQKLDTSRLPVLCLGLYCSSVGF